MYYKSNKVILVFKGAYDRKITILVGFLYKNLGVTLTFPLYLLSPTMSDANREERTDYYILKYF
jgi:hypothetical protein